MIVIIIITISAEHHRALRPAECLLEKAKGRAPENYELQTFVVEVGAMAGVATYKRKEAQESNVEL